ncbi:diguanylate phosphodiesterase, partial [Yersinia pestis]
QSLNPHVSASNPLKLEFLPSTAEEDAVQISIDTQSKTVSSDKTPGKPSVFQSLKRELHKQSAPVNALVTFSFSAYDPELLQSDWATFSGYFKAAKEFLTEQTHIPLFKLEYDVVVGLFQADSKAILESKLISLNAL